MQLLLQNFICLLRDSHTARTTWSLKKRMDFLLLIAVYYIHAFQYPLTHLLISTFSHYILAHSHIIVFWSLRPCSCCIYCLRYIRSLVSLNYC